MELKKLQISPEQTAQIPKIQVNEIAEDVKELENKKNQATQKDRFTWGQALIGVPQTWWDTQGEGVTIAVLDTGVDPDHKDLKDAIVDTKDFTGDGIEDKNGHGTHCAGIIAARLNNVGTVGVAPKASLIVGKVLNNAGSGSYDWIANGIKWATKKKAHIISMSLGGPFSTDGLYNAVHEALAQGTFMICAAGNEGSIYTNSISYPGRYGGVITVAAHDRDGNRAGFSSRGGEIDFMAPGTDIWSTYKNGSYASLSGTSMATPFLAGLAALITSKHINASGPSSTPLKNNDDLMNHMLTISAHPGFHDNQRGYGPIVPFSF